MAPSQKLKKIPMNLKLGEKLMVSEDINVDLVLEALDGWMECEVFKVVIDEASRAGVVWTVERQTGKLMKEIARCPPDLVQHLRQLLFNRE